MNSKWIRSINFSLYNEHFLVKIREEQEHLKHIQKLGASLAHYLKFACVSRETRENKLLCQIGSFYTS